MLQSRSGWEKGGREGAGKNDVKGTELGPREDVPAQMETELWFFHEYNEYHTFRPMYNAKWYERLMERATLRRRLGKLVAALRTQCKCKCVIVLLCIYLLYSDKRQNEENWAISDLEVVIKSEDGISQGCRSECDATSCLLPGIRMQGWSNNQSKGEGMIRISKAFSKEEKLLSIECNQD